jgi:hypothetical protein
VDLVGAPQVRPRFGLETPITVTLTASLLFTVLLYVHPLEFVATLIFNLLFGLSNVVTSADGSLVPALGRGEWRPLMVFYVEASRPGRDSSCSCWVRRISSTGFSRDGPPRG